MKTDTENQSRIDYGILLSVLLLAIIGIVSLYSTSVLIQEQSVRLPIMQSIWFILGTAVAGIIMLFDSEQLWKMTTYLYWLGILGLALTLIFYDRPLAVASGAKSWITIPVINITFQTSEFAKIPYILMLSKTTTLHNSRYSNRTVQTDFMLI